MGLSDSQNLVPMARDIPKSVVWGKEQNCYCSAVNRRDFYASPQGTALNIASPSVPFLQFSRNGKAIDTSSFTEAYSDGQE